MKNCLCVLLLALVSTFAIAQEQPITGNITTATPGAGNCVTYRATNNSSLGIIVSGTWSGTLQPTINIYPARQINKKVLPVDGTTAQSTITANGGYLLNVGGFAQFQLCASAWTSGTAVVDMFSTPAGNNSTIAVAPGSSGTVNAATINQLAIYAASGTAVSGDARATDNGTTLAYSGTGGFNATGSGPAITQSEMADPGAPGAGIGSIYNNNAFLRWMVYNHNAGPKAIATWCATSAGALCYGGSSAVNGLNTETLLAGNSSGLGVLTETSAGVPAWIPATNSTGTAFATSTGALTNGDVAGIANASGDYGDGGFTLANIVRKDTTNTAGTGFTFDMSASTVNNAILFPAGTGTNPSVRWSGMATNTGLYSPSAAVLTWNSTGNNVADFINNGVEVANTRAFLVSSTNAGNGSVTLGLSAVGSGAGTQVWAAGNGTVADDTALLRSGSTCRIGADVTLSTSATNICSFTLPNVSKVWAVNCEIGWAVTAGTTPTLAFGVNASQTPAATTNIFAEIKTTNANTATEGSAALSASGAVSVLTSPTLTTSATLFQAKLFGTISASATSGTFAVTATGTGASFAGAVKAGSFCYLN
jgi:hypothetical protein